MADKLNEAVCSGPFMHPVIHLPEDYWVFDFTKGADPDFVCPYEYQIGRYDEVRPGMYDFELFGGVRDLHVGIDIGGPVGTPVHAFSSGFVFSMGINPEEGSFVLPFDSYLLTDVEIVSLPTFTTSTKLSLPL